MVSQNLSIVMPHSKSLLRTIRQRLSEPLYVSSIYLMGGTIVSSVFGFLFWLIAARLTTTSDVGLATAIISSIALLTGMFDCGLGPSLIYYASAKHQNPMGFIKTAIGFGWIVSSIVGISYLIGLPFWSPALVEIQQNYLITVIFVVFTTINFVLGLQDVAMLSLRKTQYVFWRNVACNTPPTLLLLVFYLFGAGYEIIFLAYTIPNIIVGIIVGLFILPRYLKGYTFFGSINFNVASKMTRYGLVNHVSNLLWGLPNYVLPLITVNLISPEATGYFFVSWTVVNFILIIPRTVTTSLFAEGSRQQGALWKTTRQALILIFGLSLPLLVGLWYFGTVLLGLFGKGYADETLLRILLLSFVPFSINSIYFIILRIQSSFIGIICFAGTVAISVLVGAVLLISSFGLYGIALGWLVGHTTTMVCVVVIAIVKSKKTTYLLLGKMLKCL